MADQQRDQNLLSASSKESPLPHRSSSTTTTPVAASVGSPSLSSTRRRSPSDSTVGATTTTTRSPSGSLSHQQLQQQQQPVVARIQPEMAGPAASLLDAFRKRSKSDSKSKRPSFISAIRNSHLNPFGDHRNRASSAAATTSSGGSQDSGGSRGGLNVPHVLRPNHPLASCPVTPNHVDPYYTYSYQGEYKSRSRRDSGSSVPRVFDIFNRSRSQSVAGAPTELSKQQSASQRELMLDKLDLSDIMNAAEGMVFVKFFQYYQCYDLIPISAKLIVFDTQLLVKKAFHALISNGVRAVPLWESASQSFVGMVTITDFINILRTYYRSPSAYKMEELEEQKLELWRTVLANESRTLVSITPQARLFEVIKTLIHNKVHRLPVIDPDTGNVLYIMTHKRILKFLFLYYQDLPLPAYVDRPIGEIPIGTYDNIATASMSTPLIEALDMFIERRVSALPVVDAKGKVIDIYAKFDVINLATEKTYNNLDMTIRKALEFRSQYFEGVVKCTRQDSFRQLIEKIVRAEVCVKYLPLFVVEISWHSTQMLAC